MYTRLSTGEPLRHLDAEHRAALMNRWYWSHHARLTDTVDAALEAHGRCLIVDVHSFSSVPLPHEPDQDRQRPELCIGVDAFHSPFQDDQEAMRIARAHGFTKVALNRPFSGSIVPAKHWNTTRAVQSVMIEVRRDLYMDQESGDRRSDFDDVATRLARLTDSLYECCAQTA